MAFDSSSWYNQSVSTLYIYNDYDGEHKKMRQTLQQQLVAVMLRLSGMYDNQHNRAPPVNAIYHGDTESNSYCIPIKVHSFAVLPWRTSTFVGSNGL